MSTILIAEHDPALRQQLASFFREQGYDVTATHHGAEAIQKLQQQLFDLILTELCLPENSGVEILRLASGDGLTPVLILAGPEEASLATEALKLGAEDYLLKQLPFNFEEAYLRAQHVLEHRRMAQAIAHLRRVQPGIRDCEWILQQGSPLQHILGRLRRDIVMTSPMLITGEPGTGKMLLAAGIHVRSPRKDHPFVTVNCAAVPERLLESELFGHDERTFPRASARRTGCLEQAHLGTLFLPHVEAMSPRLQLKMLRILQERKFEPLGSSRTRHIDVRVIAATDRDLQQEIRASRFRADLYARLRAISVEIPPLRQCRKDILPLAHIFLEHYRRLYGRQVKEFDQAAQRGLLHHSWPGNLRELEHTIARGVLLQDGEVMRLSHLGLGEPPAAHAQGEERIVKLPPHGTSLRQIEKEALLQALESANWVQKTAAARLDISPRVMYYKLKSHGITHPKWAKRR
jgi:DNA-binding NtrC family response regulator